MIQTHDVYHPLYTDGESFIFLVTGGRGSGKTYGISTFVSRLTFEYSKPTEEKALVHQILYTR